MTQPTVDDVEQFRERARAWIEANLEPRDGRGPRPFDIEVERVVQARMFDAGFTGFAFPAEYGGGGLTVEHQKAFFEEAEGYVLPSFFAVSIGMLGPTILDYGTEEQKARHLPKILRGDEIFVQLLSEPSGGSDLAGALTRATRDGDTWVINGSKIWTSGADIATHGLMLARTDWNVPEAPRPLDVHRAARRLPGRDDRADPAGQPRSRLLPGVLRRRHRFRPTTSSGPRTTAGRWRNVCCSTNATRPPASGSATATWATARVEWALT